LRGVVGPMPDKARNYLERLQSDSHRLLATVNDILDLRQIENKTLVLTRAIAPVGLVIREGAEALEIQAQAKRITIGFDLGYRELFCWCDVHKIERVVLNVVGNSVKFTGENGIIKVSLQQNPDNPKHALLTVSDTGMGIPPEVLPKISQRYFRVGDHVSGAGLGLAISREIIELHGGSMDFASPVPGSECGTAVYVSLPLAPEPLVVSLTQDAETAAFLKERITGLGYELFCTDSSRDALQSCWDKLPAVFVLDRRITDMDVRDMVLRLRENPKTKRMPVIAFGHQVREHSELELYHRFGIYCTDLPWDERELKRSLAMAVLGKLR
jgi:two-component system sensor histidine kinase/response regulator